MRQQNFMREGMINSYLLLTGFACYCLFYVCVYVHVCMHVRVRVCLCVCALKFKIGDGVLIPRNHLPSPALTPPLTRLAKGTFSQD